MSPAEHDPETHAFGLDPNGGYRFSLATNAEHVCAEIMRNQKSSAYNALRSNG
jgi:hypothetical protein